MELELMAINPVAAATFVKNAVIAVLVISVVVVMVGIYRRLRKWGS